MKHVFRCVLACLAALCALLGTTAFAEDAQPQVLIAYYSYTGNTQEAALELARLTGGDLARIERAQAYPEDNDAFLKLAEREIREGDKPDITVTLSGGQALEDLSGYDFIYVGYPIWWDDAPAMIASFLDSYDFSGKTIIPFNTHGGSQFSHTIQTIAQLQPNAEVVTNGFTVSRNAVGNSKGDIVAWLSKLGYAN